MILKLGDSAIYLLDVAISYGKIDKRTSIGLKVLLVSVLAYTLRIMFGRAASSPCNLVDCTMPSEANLLSTKLLLEIFLYVHLVSFISRKLPSMVH